jgi:hypothetical protein
MIFLMIMGAVFALDLDIAVQDKFHDDESLQFTYSLMSDSDTETTFVPYMFCMDSPVALLQEQHASLKAGIPFIGTYAYGIQGKDLEPTTCAAMIHVIAPIDQRAEKEFTIDTLPSYDFSSSAGNKPGETTFQKIFYLGDTFYFNNKNEAVIAKITFPDGKTLPADAALLDQLGTYTLTYSLQKQGFKPIIDQKTRFAVITGPAKPIVISPAAPQKKNLVGASTGITGRQDKSIWLIGSIFGFLISIAVLVLTSKKR